MAENTITNWLVVANKAELYALQNHMPGEMVYCEDEQKVYSWQEDSGWAPMTFENEGISMNLYDLNKNIMNQLSPMTKEELAEKEEIFENLKIKFGNKHYMLLCRDYNYYTTFEKSSLNNEMLFEKTVSEIITEIGKIISIELTETEDAIELWIVPEGEEEAYAFYLFPYDAGVVYYE